MSKPKKASKKRGKSGAVLLIDDTKPTSPNQQETVCTCGQTIRATIPHWLTFHAPTPDNHLVALVNCPRCLSSYIFATDHPPVKTMFNGLSTVESFYTAMEALEKAGWLEQNARYEPDTLNKGFNPKGMVTDG